IKGRYLHRRRRYFRILRHRQGEHRHGPRQHEHDGDDGGENRTIDEESRNHEGRSSLLGTEERQRGEKRRHTGEIMRCGAAKVGLILWWKARTPNTSRAPVQAPTIIDHGCRKTSNSPSRNPLTAPNTVPTTMEPTHWTAARRNTGASLNLWITKKNTG